MPVVRITSIPENRRDALVEVESEVRNFRAATAVVVRDFAVSCCSKEYKNRVMRQWMNGVKETGGFAVRNARIATSGDGWVLYEYEENVK
jgi:hypothetical protein